MTPRRIDAKTANRAYDVFIVYESAFNEKPILFKAFGHALRRARAIKRACPGNDVELYGRRYGCAPELLDISRPLRDL